MQMVTDTSNYGGINANEVQRARKKKLIQDRFAKYKTEAVYNTFFAKQPAQQTE